METGGWISDSNIECRPPYAVRVKAVNKKDLILLALCKISLNNMLPDLSQCTWLRNIVCMIKMDKTASRSLWQHA